MLCLHRMTKWHWSTQFLGKQYAHSEDVLVVGFDGIAAIQYSNPPLPSVRQPLDKLAEMAANALL